MCDTMVALGNATADGSVIFGKNSDRNPNEAHQLVLVPHATHRPGSVVRCTHVEVPQVPETYAVLLAKPFWIWGAEMGANERGVVIGNEAVHTRMPLDTGPGLIGMDFIRLALERAGSARSALEVITGLLSEYGQGGNCALGREAYYHNSFIIADPGEAWVLETAGRQWAAERVRDVRAISNLLTIGREWDLASEGLVDEAIERGWCRSRDDFDFARCYADPGNPGLPSATARYCRSADILQASRGRITVATLMALLRDHGPVAGPGWVPGPGPTSGTICVHAAFDPEQGSQSVGSLVSKLTPELQTHWATGTSAPCTGIFKPIWIDAGLPDLGPLPTGTRDTASLWWRHEVLHRAVVRGYAARLGGYRAERDELEAAFMARAELPGLSPSERAECSARSFALANAALARWTGSLRDLGASPS